MPEVERISKEKLTKFFSTTNPFPLTAIFANSPCEVCNRAILTHEWVDMDDMGFIVHCSNEEINDGCSQES